MQPGTFSYQYLVDGVWMTSPDASVGPDDDGHLCNKVTIIWPIPFILLGRHSVHRHSNANLLLQMTVEVPPAFHIYYATGWEKPILNVRALSADGTQQTSVSHRTW